MIERAWYVLQVMTGKEQQVAKAAREAGIEALVPMRTMSERKGRKWEQITRVLIPSYVFVQAQLTIPDYYRLTALHYVVRMLGMAQGKPQAVPPQQMQIVLTLSNGGEPLGISTIYKVGGRYRVRSGPLAALEARITQIDARQRRARVLIPLLDDEREIVMGIELLGPLGNNHIQGSAG